MDIIAILEQFGVPVGMCIAFGYFIFKQNKWIQDDLKRDLDDANERFEKIVIGLINSQKQMQLDIKDSKASYRAIVEILAAMSGNGLKEKFLNKQRDNY
jgi:biopolymer transport protein ExbD|tara:strand:- start:696 stop:992 length:297 start_codon:yes stop_codon:yes gene_type:complete